MKKFNAASDFSHPATRRQLLQWSANGCLGLSLGGLLRAQSAHADSAEHPANTAKIRSCILIFYYGGPSHLDTYDLKPNAPAEVRGEFKPISTSVPGMQVCEHLPHMSKLMHKVALIRSMHHTNRLHDSASTEALTGRQSPNGDREEAVPIEQFFPCHGATLSYLRSGNNLDVSHAALPYVFHNVVNVPCQGGGFLGRAFDPLQISVNPDEQTYHAGALKWQDGLSPDRILERRRLLDDLAAAAGTTKTTDEWRRFCDRAYRLLSSKEFPKAIDLTQEPAAVRERYGLYPSGTYIDNHTTPGGPKDGFARNMRGQNLLLARRLVEAGVPFVSIYDYRQQGLNWDAHSNNFYQHKNHLLPLADQSLSALIEDLDQRGLLDTTLIVAMGEFGRTPKINEHGGRDHWPDCYTVLLAGGGVKGGFVYGSSDRLGAFPATDAATPADLAATIFWRFGIAPGTEIHDFTGQPWRVADGQPITQLFA